MDLYTLYIVVGKNQPLYIDIFSIFRLRADLFVRKRLQHPIGRSAWYEIYPPGRYWKELGTQGQTKLIFYLLRGYLDPMVYIGC